MKHLVAGFFLLLLTNAAQAKLEITKVEAVHGVLGPERKSLDFYPFDEVFFRYEVNGAKVDNEGKTEFEVAIKLINPEGKTVFERKAKNQRQLSLGGNSFPSYAVLTAPATAPAGEYTFVVEVHDLLSKETAKFERKLTCKPMSFQILDVRFWRDVEAKVPAPAGGYVGERIHFKLRVIGFDKTKKKVLTSLTITILDEAGKPVEEKPRVIKAEQNDPDEAAKATQVNYNGALYLNRPGNFTLRLTVDDLIGKQTTTVDMPLKVLAP